MHHFLSGKNFNNSEDVKSALNGKRSSKLMVNTSMIENKYSVSKDLFDDIWLGHRTVPVYSPPWVFYDDIWLLPRFSPVRVLRSVSRMQFFIPPVPKHVVGQKVRIDTGDRLYLYLLISASTVTASIFTIFSQAMIFLVLLVRIS
ncbi:uncharacterized protein LOC143148815 [Ptiloglossa arizonensis]|uniref:uncharacterized protein LOC143148815 n=1 Tax=Ptiloglossa arizonensis TaxID=3350558 RepID=UPI003FA1353C